EVPVSAFDQRRRTGAVDHIEFVDYGQRALRSDFEDRAAPGRVVEGIRTGAGAALACDSIEIPVGTLQKAGNRYFAVCGAKVVKCAHRAGGSHLEERAAPFVQPPDPPR